MDVDAHLTHYLANGAALAAAAQGQLDTSVPSCPEWTVADLLSHVGRVHTWVHACLGAPPDERPRFGDAPRPPDPNAIIEWYVTAHRDLGRAFTAVDPDRLVPSFVGTVPARWWARRQAHETAVHRWDAENACGAAPPIDAALAVDGCHEFLDVFVPLLGQQLAGNGETIHLHATDAEGEWLITRGSEGSTVTHDHAKGDTAIRGTASDLLLLLWGRRSPAQLESFGDTEVFDAWRANATF